MAETKLTRELDKAFLKRRSKQSGFNLKLLATEAGLAHGYVRSIMSGGIQKPPAAKLVKLAEPLVVIQFEMRGDPRR